MGKPVNRTLIGAFVVGAAVLAIAGVIVFGAGDFLGNRKNIIMYYDGSVKGLSVGAPVVFRGVKIGTVTNISLIFDQKNLTFTIPVIAELDLDKIKTVGEPLSTVEDYVRQLTDKGGRAQLQVSNFVTGQLLVGLDFFPEQPARFVGLDKRYIEVPTVPSSMDEISKTLAHLPINDMVKKVSEIFSGLDKLLNSSDASSSISLLRQDLKEAGTTLRILNSRLSPILSNVSETTAHLKAVSESTDQAFAGNDGVPAQLGRTLAAARSTLQKVEQTLTSLDGKTSENSVLMNDVGRALEEFSETARSFRVLSDYLQQHPEALLRGKTAP